MAIENSVSNDFLSTFVESINIFDCRLPSVLMAVSDGLRSVIVAIQGHYRLL